MKYLFTKFLASLLVFFVCACGDDDPDILPVGDTLEGSWIMTEHGFSPGAGYITKDVPTDPAKTITFRADGTLTSNVEGFSDHPYYKIIAFPDHPETKVVAVFTTPPQGSYDAYTVKPAYFITFTEELLKLGQVGCIEGCHIGLKRIAEPESGSEQ